MQNTSRDFVMVALKNSTHHLALDQKVLLSQAIDREVHHKTL